jgi:beta-galactosidase
LRDETSGRLHGPTIAGRVAGLLYGGDYNPEQWPETVWRSDVLLMREAGVNLVTVAVFAWARLEPEPGRYRFDWLDQLLDLLHRHGIAADLATATASPPAWLARRHPESLPVTADGVTLWPGSRQHWCPSSLAYREAALALVERLAERYAEHPALAMWHVGNEYGCHVDACWCDASAAAFRAWLRRRYETLERLNQAWGTDFWSQRYGDWEEINPPRRTPAIPNPAQQLDFRRFSNDALLECYLAEREVLLAATPEIPVTTNFMGLFQPLDYRAWAREVDVVADDSYPDPGDPDAQVRAAATHDLMRSLGGGRPWMLMEQAPGAVNWRPRNLVKRPGRMRLGSYQAVARGADGVMFFQWRASRAGAEKWHSAMVPHAGTGSRVWREVVQLGGELGRLGEIAGSTVRAEVAIAFSWESWWALELPARPNGDLRLVDLVLDWYRPLFAANLAVDFVAPDAPLSGYRLVLVPACYLLRDAAAANLERFAQGGGTLAVTFASGLVDEHDQVGAHGYLGLLAEVLGISVEEIAPMAAGEQQAVAWDGRAYPCQDVCDVLTVGDATTVATFADDFYAGRAAVTRRVAGAGTAWYVATRPGPELATALVAALCRDAAVRAGPALADGVEAVRREHADRRFLFLLNHGAQAAEVPLPRGCRSLLDGGREVDVVTLEPAGVAVLEEPAGAREEAHRRAAEAGPVAAREVGR